MRRSIRQVIIPLLDLFKFLSHQLGEDSGRKMPHQFDRSMVLPRNIALVDQVINFWQPRKQLAFEKFC